LLTNQVQNKAAIPKVTQRVTAPAAKTLPSPELKSGLQDSEQAQVFQLMKDTSKQNSSIDGKPAIQGNFSQGVKQLKSSPYNPPIQLAKWEKVNGKWIKGESGGLNTSPAQSSEIAKTESAETTKDIPAAQQPIESPKEESSPEVIHTEQTVTAENATSTESKSITPISEVKESPKDKTDESSLIDDPIEGVSQNTLDMLAPDPIGTESTPEHIYDNPLYRSNFKAKKRGGKFNLKPHLSIWDKVKKYVPMGTDAATGNLEKGTIITSGTKAGFSDNGIIEKGAADKTGLDLSSSILENFKVLKEYNTSGEQFAARGDWSSFLNLLTTSARVELQILSELEKYKVTDIVSQSLQETLLPGIGAALQVFQSGIKLWQQNEAIDLLNNLKSSTNGKLTDEELDAIDMYISKVNVEKVKTGIEVALNLVSVATSFFPPFSLGPTIAKAATACIFGGINAWNKYKGAQEKRALMRIKGDELAFSNNDLLGLQDVNNKIKQEKPDIVSKVPTLSNLATVKLSINKIESELELNERDPIANEKLIKTNKEELIVFNKALEDNLMLYNQSFSTDPHFATVTLEDIDNISILHRNTIMRIIEEAKDLRGKFTTVKKKMGIAQRKYKITEKDKNLIDLFSRDYNESDVDAAILSLAENVDNNEYFWDKTKVAIDIASKGRSHFSKGEMTEQIEEILTKYGISDSEKAKIKVL
jgi:hypothetical protein